MHATAAHKVAKHLRRALLLMAHQLVQLQRSAAAHAGAAHLDACLHKHSATWAYRLPLAVVLHGT
jgi:hypothetical protein